VPRTTPVPSCSPLHADGRPIPNPHGVLGEVLVQPCRQGGPNWLTKLVEWTKKLALVGLYMELAKCCAALDLGMGVWWASVLVVIGVASAVGERM
jgi:hypothetical protein